MNQIVYQPRAARGLPPAGPPRVAIYRSGKVTFSTALVRAYPGAFPERLSAVIDDERLCFTPPHPGDSFAVSITGMDRRQITALRLTKQLLPRGASRRFYQAQVNVLGQIVCTEEQQDDHDRRRPG